MGDHFLWDVFEETFLQYQLQCVRVCVYSYGPLLLLTLLLLTVLNLKHSYTWQCTYLVTEKGYH